MFDKEYRAGTESAGSTQGAAAAAPGKQTLAVGEAYDAAHAGAQGGLPRVDLKPTIAAPDDKAFVKAFVAEFRESLVAFPEVKPVTETTGTDDEREARITAAANSLKTLFETQQRKLLLDFIATRLVPDDLFTGSVALGKATVPQRTLVSAHLLAKGVTGIEKPGDAQTQTGKGKFRAMNCGHWAQSVWIYAGVASAAGDPGAGAGTTLGTMGPTGQISFPGANPGQPIGPHSDKLTKKADADHDDMTGACHAPSGRFDTLGAPDLKKQWEYLNKPEPGDWIWIDNGKTAGHSLIFVDWVTRPVDAGGSAQGKALCFSQLNNGTTAEGRKKEGHEDGGGELHQQTLGYPFGGGVCPLTMIRRPAKDAAAPTDANTLLHVDRTNAAKANAKQIKDHGVSLALYHRQMGIAVSGLLGASDKYNAATRTLCASIQTEAMSSVTVESLSTLIALTQRMSSTDKGRAITGILDLNKKTDIALVPGGLPALKQGAATDLPWD